MRKEETQKQNVNAAVNAERFKKWVLSGGKYLFEVSTLSGLLFAIKQFLGKHFKGHLDGQ